MVKNNIRINDMSIDVLKSTIMSDLNANGISVELESSTEELVQLNVKRGIYKSTVQLERNRHRPLYVQLNVDYLIQQEMNKELKKMAKMQTRRNISQGFGGGFFRIYFLFIVLGFVATILYLIIDAIMQSTTGTTLAIVIVVTLILLIIFNPLIQSRINRGLQNFDQEVLDIVSGTLERLRKEDSKIKQRTTVKCWNCFEDIKLDSSFCEKCGEQQDLL
jgi:hypothetical protein